MRRPDTSSPGDEPDGVPFFHHRARTVGTILVAVLLAGGGWLLVGQAADSSHLLRALHRVGVGWLVLALAGSAVGRSGA